MYTATLCGLAFPPKPQGRRRGEGGASGLRLGVPSGFAEQQGDAAHDEVVGRGVGLELERFNGEVEAQGAEDEAIREEVREADGEVSATTDSVEGGAAGPVGGQRGVEAVQHGQRVGLDEGVHGGGVSICHADGDEALPGTAGLGAADAEVAEGVGGQMKLLKRGGGADVRLKDGAGVGDDGDAGDVFVDGGELKLGGGGQQISDGQVLDGEDAVQRFKGKLSALTEKVRQMRLSIAGLARQKRHAESAPVYPAKQLQAEPFVHLGKVHLWKFHHQQ